MELKQYLQILQRWSWLLILGLVLGGAGGYAGSLLQQPVYQASTRALVMRAPQERSSDLTYLSDQQLVQTYVQLLDTQPVRDGASERLGYPIEEEQIKVQQTRDTQIIALTVEDPSPQRAADIANVLIEVLIVQNETLQAGRYASTEESIQAQIAQVEDQINSLQLEVDQLSTQDFQDRLKEVEAQIKPLQEEVAVLQTEIAALEPAWSSERKTQIVEKQARIEQIQPLLNLYQQIYSNLVVLGRPAESGANTSSRLAQLQSTLDLYQNLYINLLSSLETVRLARLQNTPNIVQIEPASLPEKPVRPRPLINTALAAVIGLLLAGGIAFLVEYLDDTLKTPEDVEHILGLPVLGFVAEMNYKKKSAEEVYVARQPRSPVSEAFRSLRTNIEFSAVNKPIHTILVTSPGPTEGKTTIAANLAVIFSQAGKRVALVDADMRRPHVHMFFGVPNQTGLSDLFRSVASAVSVSQGKEELPHLMIITSGSLPPNPAELLGSERMGLILAELRKFVDIIVIDTPPSLVVDAQVLSARVDAVLFVVQPGMTHEETARASLEMFKRAGARVIGAVMNRIPRNRSYYYGGYRYYSPYDRKGHYYSPSGDRPVVAQSLKMNLLEKSAENSEIVGFGSDESMQEDIPRNIPSPSGSFLTRTVDKTHTVPSPDPSKI
jgi:capsular exopolysaccharide synthesis family protein